MSPPPPLNYARTLVKVAIGQILQTVGFKTAQSTALDILVEILERYVMLIGQSAHDFAETMNRTEPSIDDVASAFAKHRINLTELDEYVNWVDMPAFSLNKHEQVERLGSTFGENGTTVDLENGGQTKHRQQAARLSSKSTKQRLGRRLDYLSRSGCDDLANKELIERQSDEEWEHIYDYMPLMTQPQVDLTNVDVLATDEVKKLSTTNLLSKNESISIVSTGDQASLNSNANAITNETSKVVAAVAADFPSPLTTTPTNKTNTDANINLLNEDNQKTTTTTTTSSVIEKNGIKYSNFTWQSMYEPKFVSGRLKLAKNSRRLSSNNEEVSMTSRIVLDAKMPAPKLPLNFNKPRSKYKKNIYNTAVSIYNKLIPNTCEPLEEIIDEEKLLKQQQAAAAAAAELLLVQAQQTSSTVVEVSASTSSTSTPSLLPCPKVEAITISTTIDFAAEPVQQLDSVSTTTTSADNAVAVVNDSTTTATMLPVPSQQQQQQQLKLKKKKLKVDEMLEAFMTKYSSSSNATPTSSSISNSITTTDSSLPTSGIKLKFKERLNQNNLNEIVDTTSTNSLNEPAIPKIKFSNLLAPSSKEPFVKLQTTSADDYNFDELNNTTSNLLQPSSSSFILKSSSSNSRFDSNDHFDDNAMDGDLIKTTTTSKSRGENSNYCLNDQLIWTPITTKTKTQEPKQDDNAFNDLTSTSRITTTQKQQHQSSLAQFSIKNQQSSITPSLVDYSSNSMESTNSMSTTTNQQPTTTVPQLPIQQTLLPVVASSTSSSKHKKKKKNKEKEKVKEKEKDKEKEKETTEKSSKSKEKSKDKKHHHHHKKKEKDKQHKSSETGVSNDQTQPLSPSSKKKDKKLKKLLRKEQKKLLKKSGLSVSASLPAADQQVVAEKQQQEQPVEESSEKTQVSSDHSGNDVKQEKLINNIIEQTEYPQEVKLEKFNDEKEGGKNKKDEIEEDQQLKISNSNQPPLPKLKLKIPSSSNNNPNRPEKSTHTLMTTSQSEFAQAAQSNLVKPFKINIGKTNKNTMNQTTPVITNNNNNNEAIHRPVIKNSPKENENLSDEQLFLVNNNNNNNNNEQQQINKKLTASVEDEEEIELGEVVKPKMGEKNVQKTLSLNQQINSFPNSQLITSGLNSNIQHHSQQKQQQIPKL